jgi:hypothetical protein
VPASDVFDGAGVGVRAPGSRFKRGGVVGLGSGHQLVYPLAGDVVVAGDLAFAAPYDHHRGDDELRLRHRRPPRLAEVSTMSRDSRQPCREITHCPRYERKYPWTLAGGCFHARWERVGNISIAHLTIVIGVWIADQECGRPPSVNQLM